MFVNNIQKDLRTIQYNGRKWRKFIELTLVLFDDVENKNKTSSSNLSTENTRLTKWLFKYKSLIIRTNEEIKEMEEIKDEKHVTLTMKDKCKKENHYLNLEN